MTEREQPILFTPNMGDVVFTNATLDAVEVSNHTDRMAAYVITVVPRSVVKLASVPWGRVARDVGAAVKQSGVLGTVLKLFGR
jgi:hypothetical protein